MSEFNQLKLLMPAVWIIIAAYTPLIRLSKKGIISLLLFFISGNVLAVSFQEKAYL